jgi:hypothetical protein
MMFPFPTLLMTRARARPAIRDWDIM